MAKNAKKAKSAEPTFSCSTKVRPYEDRNSKDIPNRPMNRLTHFINSLAGFIAGNSPNSALLQQSVTELEANPTQFDQLVEQWRLNLWTHIAPDLQVTSSGKGLANKKATPNPAEINVREFITIGNSRVNIKQLVNSQGGYMLQFHKAVLASWQVPTVATVNSSSVQDAINASPLAEQINSAPVGQHGKKGAQVDVRAQIREALSFIANTKNTQHTNTQRLFSQVEADLTAAGIS